MPWQRSAARCHNARDSIAIRAPVRRERRQRHRPAKAAEQSFLETASPRRCRASTTATPADSPLLLPSRRRSGFRVQAVAKDVAIQVSQSGPLSASLTSGGDLDLWLRLADRGRLANLNRHILRYRLHPESHFFGATGGAAGVRPACGRRGAAAAGRGGFRKLCSAAFAGAMTLPPFTPTGREWQWSPGVMASRCATLPRHFFQRPSAGHGCLFLDIVRYFKAHRAQH